MGGPDPVGADGGGFGRVIHVANSVWALSPLDARAFGMARRRPRLTHTEYVEPPDPGIRYGEFLRAILAPGTAGRCWLLRNAQAERGEGGWVEAGSDDVQPLTKELDDDVRTLWTRAWLWELDTQDSAGSAVEGGTQLDELRHRIFVSGDRCAALWGADLDDVTKLDCSVLVDVRFFYRLNQVRCHVSVSIWSAPPRHIEHCPPAVANEGETELVARVEAYKEAFARLALCLRTMLGRYLSWSGFRVFGRPFGLPAFWVVVSGGEPTLSGPLKHLKRKGNAAWLARLLLDRDVQDRTVSVGIVNGDLLIMRRMVQVREPAEPRELAAPVVRDVPSYLILPTGPEVADPVKRAEVEMGTAKVITDLTDLEADVQHQLYELQADLQIWRNHLTVYNAVVERGCFLWDALSSHLLIQRNLKLARTHRTIEMAHQVLLQAVADLSHIATLVSQSVADITDACEALRASYDQELSEWRVREQASLRQSLTQTGLVERVAEYGADTLAEAGRVKAAYDDQLRAIAHAFDERRARELDGIQKAQFTVGLGAAFIGLVSIADATIQLKDENRLGAVIGPQWLDETILIISWCAVLPIVVGIAYLLWRTRRVGSLGTARFRNLYKRGWRRWEGLRLRRKHRGHGLLTFLAETSTDRLERAADLDPSFADMAGWRNRDRELACWLARLWDAGGQLARNGDERGCRDLRSLSRQTEQWAVHSLILIERARRMHLYPLPTLVALYRCCTSIRNSFTYNLLTRQINAMADVDFDRALARLGFGPDEANAVSRWLLARKYDTAAHAMAEIGRLGLFVGMAEGDRLRTLRTIGYRSGDLTVHPGAAL